MILYILNHDRLLYTPALHMFFPEKTIVYIHSRDLEGKDLNLLLNDIRLVMIGGGEQHLTKIQDYPELSHVMVLISFCLQQNIPLIGICLGCQLIGHVFGNPIKELDQVHLGHAFLEKKTLEWDLIQKDPFLGLLDFDVIGGSFSYHHDGIDPIDIQKCEDLFVLGKSYSGVPYILRHRDRPIYGFQFHPEILKHTMTWIENPIQWKRNDYYETIAKHFFSTVFQYLDLLLISGPGRDTTPDGLLHRW